MRERADMEAPPQTDMFGGRAATVMGVLKRDFIMPPFSILDARSGDWQDRKRAWIACKLKSEETRENAKAYPTSGNTVVAEAIMTRGGEVSIFDPVLCELMTLWFCPDGGQIIDPFAGGSVRGIVASALGRRYWGADLRPEQIAANEQQADDLLVDGQSRPQWVCGDAVEVLPTAPMGDFIFSCPPYGDLEVYSDDPRDLSTMSWEQFSDAYMRIIEQAVSRLKPDRFACYVVGDFRDSRGCYRNFSGMTIQCFELAGARFYNEAILATPTGSAPVRAPGYFNASRKLVRIHQNVLIFCKGDPKRAAQACKQLSVEQLGAVQHAEEAA